VREVLEDCLADMVAEAFKGLAFEAPVGAGVRSGLAEDAWGVIAR